MSKNITGITNNVAVHNSVLCGTSSTNIISGCPNDSMCVLPLDRDMYFGTKGHIKRKGISKQNIQKKFDNLDKILS